MGNGEYQRRRRVNLRLSILALLFGPLLGSFLSGIVGSQVVLAWLPFEPWIHNAHQWVQSAISVLLNPIGIVMLVHVLVWWVWRDVQRSEWRVGFALLVALTIGTIPQFYGIVLSSLVFDQGSIDFESWFLSESVLAVPWILSGVTVHWVAMRAAQPAIPIRLVDVSRGGFDGKVKDRKRTWSIRQLLVATLVIAIVISVYQALNRHQQQTIGAPFPNNMGWISLISIVSYCLTNLIVLWSAAKYRMGGSSLAGYVALVVATLISLAQQLATNELVGSDFSMPIDSRAIVGTSIKITLLFAMYGWLFRKWEQAGYQLRRFT